MRSAMTRSKPAAVPGVQASQDARRIAVAILDVLAGMRKPIEAAQALGVSLPRYYLLENRALEGMILACEPRSKGRQVSTVKQIDELQRQVAALQRELARSQALARTTQRTIGLTMVSRGSGGGSGKRRQRKPVVRALKAARQLSEPVEPADAPAASTGEPSGS
jgi:hypothetical protein